MTTIELLQKTKAAWPALSAAPAEEKNRLLLSFDEAAAALLTMGASHGELVARIEKGDHRHA